MTFSGIFAIGLSGINAFAAGLEAVSSNVANSQTVGYKRARVDFADLVAGDAPAAGKLGAGVIAVGRQLLSEQGGISRTAATTNIAVAGEGYFVVSETAASAAQSGLFFTRSGDFAPNADGDLVNGAGYFLSGYPASGDGSAGGGLGALAVVNINREPVRPAGSPPLGALIGIEIDAAGRVVASYAGGETHVLYRLPLALFANPEGLERARGTAFLATAASGEAKLTAPLTKGAGALEGSALEISTVDIGAEFATLIETQRAYASSARVLSAAAELWRTLVETAA